MPHFKNYIAGEWVDSSSGETMENRNPADTDDVIGTFPAATKADVERAIDAANEALPGWANMPPPARGAILDKASAILDARQDELARALTREEGKTFAEAKGEVLRARDIFKYYAGEGWRMGGQVLPSNITGELLYTRREALGVIALVTPWNFPIAIPVWKMAPALIYGNTVVFKPASLVPYSAVLLVEALVEAGLPKGVVNLVTGSGRTVGDTLVGSKRIAGVSFTGSVSVGMGIYEKAMKNLTRVQLEMGGKNPTIVLKDADISKAVNIAVAGGFGLTGQACTATSRVIVEEGAADAFAAALTEAARNLKVGNGLESGVQMGPAVSEDQLQTDLDYVAVGQQEGAKLLAGGEQAGANGGYYVQPTVFDHVEPQMRIAQEEIFGPVIGIIRARNLDDALEKANGIGFGLSASIVTNDLQQAFQFANRIEAGVVKINEPTTGLALQAPFGGFKNSSANTFKEQGQAAIEFYTRTKTVYVGHG
ncbi:MAG: aldehyde dehydrogenase family protein [Caldilineaceae bacterium]|nr:aldehyde dehydrogenase family protein [Caldilineaceae bacterium]